MMCTRRVRWLVAGGADEAVVMAIPSESCPSLDSEDGPGQLTAWDVNYTSQRQLPGDPSLLTGSSGYSLRRAADLAKIIK